MLDINDILKSLNLPLNSILISIDIINMFPNIDNDLVLSSFVKKYLDLCSENIPLTHCLVEALDLCLTCDNSIFNNKNYLQIDSTAQDLTFQALMQILLWQILIRKLQEALSVPQCGKGLEITFLYLGHMVENIQFQFQIISTHLILHRNQDPGSSRISR